VFSAEKLAAISLDDDAARFARGLEQLRPRTARLVAARGDEILGFAILGPEGSGEGHDIGELFLLYVLPDAWGTGVGRLLMAETLTRLRREGFVEAVLWVIDANPRARRFYELAGWHQDGGLKEEEWLGTTIREVRYRIAL
jgi:GNAT superfamily N-acetyltransferase